MKTHSTNSTNTHTDELSLNGDIFTSSEFYMERFEDLSFMRKFDPRTGEIGNMVDSSQKDDFSIFKTSNNLKSPGISSSFDLTYFSSNEDNCEEFDTLTSLKKGISKLTVSRQDSQPEKPKRRRRRRKKVKVLKEYLPEKAKKKTLQQKIVSKIGHKKLAYLEKDIYQVIPALKQKTRIHVARTPNSLSNFSNIFSSNIFSKSLKKVNSGLFDCVEESMLSSLKSSSSSTDSKVSSNLPLVEFDLIKRLLDQNKKVYEEGNLDLEKLHASLDHVERKTRMEESN